MHKARHTLNRDGSITLAIRPDHGSLTEEFRLPGAVAKRLAWAILADLDPEEAAQAAAEAAPQGTLQPRCNCGCGPKLAHKPGSKTRTILEAMARGLATTDALAREIDRSPKIAASFVSHLVRDGLAERSDGGWKGQPGQWRITSAGLAVVGPARRVAA
jgi:DNA-binding HxlR family transcriptional regulator